MRLPPNCLARAQASIGGGAFVAPLDVSSADAVAAFVEAAARVAAPTHPAYCASKAGLVGLTRAVALEGGPHGVTCVAVSPGWVETEMLCASARQMAAKAGHSYEDEIAAMAASNPQNRLIQPEEIAALVAFCCSEAAAGLTMEDIQVNAGTLW